MYMQCMILLACVCTVCVGHVVMCALVYMSALCIVVVCMSMSNANWLQVPLTIYVHIWKLVYMLVARILQNPVHVRTS